MTQRASATAPAPVATPSAPAPAPVPASTSPNALAPLGAVPSTVSTPTRDTPARLRRLATVVVVTGLVTAILGTAAMVLLTLTLRQAGDEVAQLVRVQTIETDLLVADANATNTFLVGGLESPQRRAAYDAALAEVTSLVAESSQAQPADAAALAALNTQVLDYAGLVEAARANNRQGLPVGAQYLRQASNGLRSDALPIADALVSADTARAEAALNTGWGWVVPLLALGALAVLVVVQVRVARQFKRRINRGLLASSMVLGGLALVSLLAMTGLTFSVSNAASGFYEISGIGGARVQANLAKSSESLTLIARGSGAAYETGWQTAATAVRDELGSTRADAFLFQFDDYADVHAKIRQLDDGGDWDGAVALATGSDEGSANATFATFDVALAGAVDTNASSTVASLRSHGFGLGVGCVLTFLAGLAAAWSGSRGISARQREYR